MLTKIEKTYIINISALKLNMRIKKQYEVIINLNAIETYSGDMDSIIMDKLRRFEGKCLRSSMVEQVQRIIKRSMWMPAQNLADGSGNINVIFEAIAVIYNEGDIITNCVVDNIERTEGRLGLICQTDHAAVHIRGNTNLRGVQAGQTIPIKVNTVRYSKGQQSITINATPYFQSMEFYLFKTDIDPSAANQEDLEVLKTLLEQQAEAQKNIKGSEPKLVKFFTETFHPFKNMGKIKTPSKTAVKSIVDEAKRFVDTINKDAKSSSKVVYSVRHPQHTRESLDFFHMEEGFFKGDAPKTELLNPKAYQIKIVRENYAHILIAYLQEHISYLNMIYEMTQLYNTEDKRKKHKNIWAIYDRLKR
jgi:hypothetical protein